MKSSREILAELLSSALIEQDDKNEEEQPAKPDKPAKRSTSDFPVLNFKTDNSLAQGRPPNSVRDSREMAADPGRAKQLLSNLGASASGGDWNDQIASLFNSASGHDDFGDLQSGEATNVSNETKDKVGVMVPVSGTYLSQDPRATYFFIRSLYTAGINSGALSISAGDQRKIRLEKLEGKTGFIFYKGKAKSFNP